MAFGKQKNTQPTHEERIASAQQQVASALGIFEVARDNLRDAGDAHHQIAAEAHAEIERLLDVAEKAEDNGYAAHDKADQLDRFLV